MPQVAIVVHRHDTFDAKSYWLRAIAGCWRDAGIGVALVTDPLSKVSADLAVLHVDLTVVPPDYLSVCRGVAVTINGEVEDVSKRAVSRNLLSRGDRYGGPVIVKTDRNFKGNPELRLARRKLLSRNGVRGAGRFRTWIREEAGIARRWRRYGSFKALRDYPIFGSMAEVPDAVWDDDEFVVERFLPERRNGLYCVRTWLFLGDRDRHAIFYSNDPVVKSHNIVGYEPLADVPEELRRMRTVLKFDFGKFDYAMVDGHPVLFDANRTPAFGNLPSERYLPIARTLAEGIDVFLKKGMP